MKLFPVSCLTFFRKTRYKSFQRQLNLWGFVRGNDPVYKIKGTYSHPWFIRGRKDLTPLIVRVGGAGNKNKTDVLYREVEAMKAKRQQPVLPKPLSGDKRTKNFQYVETEDKLSAVVVQSKGDDLADAATSLASFHKSGSPATVPPLNTDAPKLTNETRLSRTGMMPNKMAKMDHFYANFSSKATPSPTTASTASFLNTFQNPLPLGLSLGSAGAEDTSNNPMSSVLSALSRAEVIGSLSGAAKMDGSRSGVTGGEATDVTSNYIQRLHELRAAVATHSALLEEAIKISSERKLSIPATDNFPCLDVVEAKRQNKISATDCSLAVNGSVNSHELLQHLLRQQQHQDAQVPATASTVRDFASKKNMQGSNIENMDHQRMLQLLLAGSSTGMLPSSFIMSGLNGMAAGPYSLGNINTSSSILTEELRLEKGIQTLMRERVRLEAAAILESRQQRRRQLELYARSCL